MSHMFTLLQEMRGQPLAMYLGRVSLTKLADFLRGYEHALWQLKQPDTFLSEFRDWIQAHYHTTSRSWEDLILDHSEDGADPVARFWNLLDQFVESRKAPQVSESPNPRKHQAACP
jgi:hypothetical protein